MGQKDKLILVQLSVKLLVLIYFKLLLSTAIFNIPGLTIDNLIMSLKITTSITNIIILYLCFKTFIELTDDNETQKEVDV